MAGIFSGMGGVDSKQGSKKPFLGGDKNAVLEDVLRVRYTGGSARKSTKPGSNNVTNVFIDVEVKTSESGEHMVGGDYLTLVQLNPGARYPEYALRDLKGRLLAGIQARHAEVKGADPAKLRVLGVTFAQVMALPECTEAAIDAISPDVWDKLGEECFGSAVFPLQDVEVKVVVTERNGWPQLAFSAA